MLTRRSLLRSLVTVLLIAAVLAGCINSETGGTRVGSPPSPLLTQSALSTGQPTVQPSGQATGQPTPTINVLGPLYDPDLDLRAGPVEVPLEIQIPILKVNAPILGVGLTADNMMDAPKGEIGDPVWHSAFWYRGSGIPGEPGTATIAGHVNDPLGRPEIFANLQGLHHDDVVIIHVKDTGIDMRFIVDEMKVLSVQESSDPVMLARIFGTRPHDGATPLPTPDGLSHLVLITCAGYIVDGRFDHHVVVFATLSK